MLRYKADVRTLCFIAAYFVVLGGAWSLPIHQPWAVAGAVALLAWLSWINAVITHNVVHVPLWRSLALNRLTKVVLSLTYGFPVSDYIPGHNLSHHRYTQAPRDVMRTSKVRGFRWNLLNLLTFFPAVAGDVAKANARYAHSVGPTRKQWLTERRIEIVVTWGVKLVALLLDWKRAILFVGIPHVSAVWGITTVNYLQHDGCDEDDRYNHSRNFVGRIFNWVHFNNGFHGVHHDEPGLHWSLAAQRHAETIHGRIHPALEQKSMFLYLLKTFVFETRRLTFDGKPVVLPEPEPDGDWLAVPGALPQDAE